MQQLTLVIVLSSLLAVAGVVRAQTSALTAKKQFVACMNQQMSATKSLSFNEAIKACKLQIKAQNAAALTNDENKRLLGR